MNKFLRKIYLMKYIFYIKINLVKNLLSFIMKIYEKDCKKK